MYALVYNYVSAVYLYTNDIQDYCIERCYISPDSDCEEAHPTDQAHHCWDSTGLFQPCTARIFPSRRTSAEEGREGKVWCMQACTVRGHIQIQQYHNAYRRVIYP